MVSFQLQLLMFACLRSTRPPFPSHWFPVSVPSAEAIWDGSHLQHRHLQWNDSTLLWPRLPVCSQSLSFCLNDSRWVFESAAWTVTISGSKYNNCPSLLPHGWPVVQFSCTDSLLKLPADFEPCSRAGLLSGPYPNVFLSSWSPGSLADARLAVLQRCSVLETSPDSGPTTRSAPWTDDCAGPVCRDWANLLLHRVFLWAALHLVYVAELWGQQWAVWYSWEHQFRPF